MLIVTCIFVVNKIRQGENCLFKLDWISCYAHCTMGNVFVCNVVYQIIFYHVQILAFNCRTQWELAGSVANGLCFFVHKPIWKHRILSSFRAFSPFLASTICLLCICGWYASCCLMYCSSQQFFCVSNCCKYLALRVFWQIVLIWGHIEFYCYQYVPRFEFWDIWFYSKISAEIGLLSQKKNLRLCTFCFI